MIRYCIVLAVALAGAGRANAEAITFAFTGSVEQVVDHLGVLDGSVAPGTTFTGHYTFDSETPNTCPQYDEGEGGLYHHDAPPAGVWVEVGNFVFRSVPTAPDFEIFVSPGFGFTGADQYDFHSRGNEAFGLLPGGPVDRLNIRWDLATIHGHAIDNVALPLTPPDLSAFDMNRLTIEGVCTSYGDPAAYFRISGPVTSLTLVPEPSTLLFAVVGLLGLALPGRRRNTAGRDTCRRHSVDTAVASPNGKRGHSTFLSREKAALWFVG